MDVERGNCTVVITSPGKILRLTETRQGLFGDTNLFSALDHGKPPFGGLSCK